MELIVLIFPLIFPPMKAYCFTSLQKKSREEPGHTKFSKYSAAALDYALQNDIDRLEEFAATKDLTGENILFLKTVGSWKSKWRAAERNGSPKGIDLVIKRELYDEAEAIWRRLVDRDTADFPLNIEDSVYRAIEKVFGASTPRPRASSRAIIAPFADDIVYQESNENIRRGFHGMKAKKVLGLSIIKSPSENNIMPLGPKFCGAVFDKAEASARQLVLENTWIRYVDSLPDEEWKGVRVGGNISSLVG